MCYGRRAFGSAILVLLTAAGSAFAQQVMDKSDKGLPARELKAAIDALTDDLADPYSVQLRKLRRVQDGGFCGEFNAKSRAGAYQGFWEFYANGTSRRVFRVRPDLRQLPAFAAQLQNDCR